MDQPTNLKIKITGKSESVKRAALAAQRRIDLDTNGFEENAYEMTGNSDFEEKLDKAIGIYGDYSYEEAEDETSEYSTEQESYSCIWEDDIRGIANEIIKASPDVEVHISAVITITYAEGYDLCVDIDYVDGELSVDSYEEFYEGWEEDEGWGEEDDWLEEEDE